MHRRGHKKSRNGCLECKRRHMKCDETRPQCANCTTVHRTCQYMEPQGISRVPYHSPAPAPAPAHAPASALPPASAATAMAHPATMRATSSPLAGSPLTVQSASDSSHASESPASVMSRQQATPQSQTSTPPTSQLAGGHEDDCMPISVLHAELAMNFSCTISSPEMTDLELIALANKVLTEEAVQVPFLMYECMAISARHLSVVRPDRRDFYIRHSVELQAKAISMFNDLEVVKPDQAAASLLFSSILNRLALVDVLANREGDFGMFLDRYVQSTGLQKGIRTVSRVAPSEVLMARLSPFIRWARPDRTMSTVGRHCDSLRQLISEASTLSPVEKEASLTAVHFLQLAFDYCVSPPPGQGRHQMVFIWGMYLPEEFVALLMAHRPEAVATMAWYAVLLHECRHFWQVGDAGVFVLQSVSEYLGPEWAHWLEWPRSAIQNGLSP